MPDPKTADALRRLLEYRELRLPLRRRDVLGRLMLRLLWPRHLKWQIETNIAASEVMHALTIVADGHQTHLGQIESRIANRDEVRDLQSKYDRLVAGLNQRLYSTIGTVQAQLSDLRMNAASAEESVMTAEDRLKDMERRVETLATALRDIRLHQSQLDLRLERLRAPESEAAEPVPWEDRSSVLDIAVRDLLDGPVELARKARAEHLGTIRACRENGATGPVLDMAPGRGEWLEVLRDADIPYRAASRNEAVLRRLKRLGLELADADPLRTLLDAPARSLGAVSAFRFLEHLGPDCLSRFVTGAAVALQPGGVLLVETPAAGSPDLDRDPFARTAVDPDLLAYAAQAAGFRSVERPEAGPGGDRVVLIVRR